MNTPEYIEDQKQEYQMPCPYGLDNAGEKMDTEVCTPIEKKGVDATLEQRGSVYGEWSVQLQTVAGIVDVMSVAYSMNNGGLAPTDELRAEWHYLAIKLARIAANPDYTDSYHDLAGYATLMERERA